MRLGYRKIAVFGKLSWRKAGEILIYIYTCTTSSINILLITLVSKLRGQITRKIQQFNQIVLAGNSFRRITINWLSNTKQEGKSRCEKFSPS